MPIKISSIYPLAFFLCVYGKVTEESEWGLNLGSVLNKEKRMETEVEGFTFGTYYVLSAVSTLFPFGAPGCGW